MTKKIRNTVKIENDLRAMRQRWIVRGSAGEMDPSCGGLHHLVDAVKTFSEIGWNTVNMPAKAESDVFVRSSAKFQA